VSEEEILLVLTARELIMKARNYRLITNNCGDVEKDGSDTVEGFLAHRIKALEGTGVDAISYCSHYSFNSCTHATKVGEIHRPIQGSSCHAQALIDSGRDCLQIVVDWTHDRGMDTFWSMRMNDCHDGNPKIEEVRSEFKRQHPEYLVGREEDGRNREQFVGNYRWWAGVNYAIPEVRQRAFDLIEEVCENYDVDGIELDWNRHNVYFPENRRGEPATVEHVAMLNDFMDRVRKMTERVGAKRGRPICLMVRVLDALELDLHLGLDIETWTREKLIDILAPGDYRQFTDWKECIELGHKYGVQVYPCISATKIHGRAKYIGRGGREEWELWRGDAMNIWEAGADGISIFNGCPNHVPLWGEIGDRETLLKLDKVYGPTHGSNNADAYFGEGTTEKYEQFPTELKAGGTKKRAFYVGEDVSSADLKLRIRLAGLEGCDGLSFSLNGKELDELKKVQTPDDDRCTGEIWLETRPKAELIKRQRNDVEISAGDLRQGDSGAVLWEGVQLHVGYGHK
jgi:hypothetical protein